jgi:hypothetical protein
VDLAGALTYAPCGASTSMGALAPDILYYRVMDKRSFPRSRIVYALERIACSRVLLRLLLAVQLRDFPIDLCIAVS